MEDRTNKRRHSLPLIPAASCVLVHTIASHPKTEYTAHRDSNPADTLWSRGTWAELPAARDLTFICLPFHSLTRQVEAAAAAAAPSWTTVQWEGGANRLPVRLPRVCFSHYIQSTSRLASLLSSIDCSSPLSHYNPIDITTYLHVVAHLSCITFDSCLYERHSFIFSTKFRTRQGILQQN
jgi:hypothetical protein